MKNTLKLFIAIGLASNFSCSSQNVKEPKLETQMDTVSYVIGLWIAGGPANVPDKEELNIELIKKGMIDGFKDGEPAITSAEQQKILRDFSMGQQKKQAEADAKAAETNKTEGEQFLAKNKTAKDIVTTESGLQYRVIKEGTGNTPMATDKVKVNYTGKLLNGDIFDSSEEHGKPAEFKLNQVIKGWTEGIQLMKEGAVYEFFIPSDLAYGNRAAGEKIKANSTLIFEVELLEIMKDEPAAKPE